MACRVIHLSFIAVDEDGVILSIKDNAEGIGDSFLGDYGLISI